MKPRLDRVMVERNLAPTRTIAQRRIQACEVSVDGQVVTRAALEIASGQVIAVAEAVAGFVGRGGQKLSAALDRWSIDLAGRRCLDVGTSTGGFTDCMLQRGAAQVVGIDSGHGQLAASLRNDPRLVLLERTNARRMTADMLPEPVSFFSMDVSFIAASLVLPAVIASAFPSSHGPDSTAPREAVILVKPQFEAGREFVGKHGIVRSAVAHKLAVDRVAATVRAHGAFATDAMDSPITGGDGNLEFLLYARF
ncbi:MAG: TlyA family RNA methyltransferase [Acidobacteriaceae bacterium]